MGVERQNVKETDGERKVGDAGQWENGAWGSVGKA